MKTVIGIIGPIASGKDTAAAYLAKKLGCPIFEISGHLKELATQKGVPHDRQSLIEFGNHIVKQHGGHYLPKTLLGRIHSLGIITGMRQLEQIDYLRKHCRLVLIAVDTDPKTRFERARARGRLGEATTIEQFIELETKENSGDRVQRLFECMKLADYHVTNDKNLETLHKELDRIAESELLVILSEAPRTRGEVEGSR